MSKSITISEGSQAKNFMSVSKLRTNLIGGGTQNWVPEDEAGMYANLGVAEIDKNGTYKASDEDLDGFSQVNVSVQPKTKTKTITKNGTYKASKDKVDGYSEVSVQVPTGGSGELVTKNITENGTYNASDDNADGYSSVTVNVSGGGTLITKQITQNGTYNAQDDNASGYSSVTVNVQATHGRNIVGGVNNAPVNQKISVHDFLADLSEQTYAAGMSYFTNNPSMQALLENDVRTGNWYKAGSLLNMPDIENYNLVLVGAGGLASYYMSRHDVVIWVEIVGILDDSGIVTLSDVELNKLTLTLDDGAKFALRHGHIYAFMYSGASSANRDAYTYVKEDMDNHTAGSSGALTFTDIMSGPSAITDSLPHTPVLTNLTGGTIA